ncbi:hypothetical protein AMECASPLE_025131 [Ameca splendens]|uniref:Uncharacterized protein n=1 Tax=Ameca splendens TaxID=208324 RepID=A0ABV0ZDW6_9TELE
MQGEVQFLDKAQAPLENLPDLAFTAKTSSSNPQFKFQLAASELPTSSFYRANPVHPPMSGTSKLCLLRAYQTQNDIPPGGPSTTEKSEKSRFIVSPLLWQNKRFKFLHSSECFLHVGQIGNN